MRPRTRGRAVARAGFTLVETAIGVGLLGLFGLVTVASLDAGFDTQGVVVANARRTAGLRAAGKELSRELRYAVQASIAIEAQPDQNHRLEFQELVPGGAGIVDPAFDPPEQLGWRHRLEVAPTPEGLGLVRSVVDDQDLVRSSRTVAAGLAQEPGSAFRVEPVGDLLRITLRVERETGDNDAELVLEIAPRN